MHRRARSPQNRLFRGGDLASFYMSLHAIRTAKVYVYAQAPSKADPSRSSLFPIAFMTKGAAHSADLPYSETHCLDKAVGDDGRDNCDSMMEANKGR